MSRRNTNTSMAVVRQRYAESKYSSSSASTTITESSIPLTEGNLSHHELTYNTTPTTGMTSFLPTLHSTPPMPTSQKPSVQLSDSPTQSSNVNRRAGADENNNTNATAFNMSTNALGHGTDSQTPVFARRRANNNTENAPPARLYIPHRSPQTVDGYQSAPGTGHSTTRGKYSRSPTTVATTPLIDRIPDTPPLPTGWNERVDKLICSIDLLGGDHARIVKKVRQFHPRLAGVLTPTMIDRRLRQLDQDINIDYWSLGLQSIDASDAPESQEERDLHKASLARQENRPLAMRQKQEQHSAALRQQQGEERHQNWSSQYSAATRSRDGDWRAASPSLRVS